jgi:hypothetical protein
MHTDDPGVFMIRVLFIFGLIGLAIHLFFSRFT